MLIPCNPTENFQPYSYPLFLQFSALLWFFHYDFQCHILVLHKQIGGLIFSVSDVITSNILTLCFVYFVTDLGINAPAHIYNINTITHDTQSIDDPNLIHHQYTMLTHQAHFHPQHHPHRHHHHQLQQQQQQQEEQLVVISISNRKHVLCYIISIQQDMRHLL